MNEKKIYIGLGTGRCGTKSLSKLMKIQGLNVDHETNTSVGEKLPLSWDKNLNELDERLKYIIENNLDGDIGFYYLPYVDDILLRFKNVKFIVLKRDKESTIKSYIKWVGNRNHWMMHDGTIWDIDNKWDRAYPKYVSKTREEALSNYYTEYYEICNKYEKIYNNFKVFNTEDLNDHEKVNYILNFLGVENKNIVTNIKENEKK